MIKQIEYLLSPVETGKILPMIKKTLLLTFILALTSSYGYAQESQTFIPPTSDWVNKAAERIKILNQQSLEKSGGVVPKEIHMSVVKYAYMEPDQFGILMKTPETTTGCYDISPIAYEAKFIGNLYMDVEVQSYDVKPVKIKHGSFECNQGYKRATGLIVLNISDLKERGTRQIRFTNGESRDTYEVIINDNKITLQPQSMIAFKTHSGNLTYTMGGGGIIALQVPMAKDGDNIAQRVRTLAAQNSLTPITDASAFNLKENENIFYYQDEDGRFSDMLESDGYAELGEIPVARPYIAQNGQQQMAVPLKVFVTKHNNTL